VNTTPEQRGPGPDCAAALARLLRVAARLFCGAGVLLIGIALMQPESPLPFAQGGTALLVCALACSMSRRRFARAPVKRLESE